MSASAAHTYGNLPRHWQIVTFGELIDRSLAELQTGPFGTALAASEYRTKGTPVIAVQHIGDNRVSNSDIPRVGDATVERLARYRLKVGDILFARKGAVERRALIRDEEEGWLQGSDCIRLRLAHSFVDPVFISYALGTMQYRNWIVQNAQGATMPSLNQEILRRVPVLLPPLPEQRAIAAILAALDDKIELNRRMNRTLEAMARAVFQSWFVDFDPVRARAAGQDTGLPAEIAALFPDRLVESELGEIPEGWNLRPIGTLCDVNSWTLKSSDELGEIEYIEIADVSRGDVNKTSIWARGNEPSRARRRLRHGDTALSTVRPERQAYFLCLNPAPNLIASTGFAVFTPKLAPWTYVHIGLTQPEVFQQMGHLADGGAYPAISPDLIGASQIACPDNISILDAFHEMVSSAFLKMQNNRQESRTLAALRDALLPKLISGELRVPAAADVCV